jgi:hypothetical protein
MSRQATQSKESYQLKFLLGIALALGISAAAYAAAATVSVNGGTLQYGEDNDLTCTASADVDGWGADADTGTTTYVRITYDPVCAGNDMFIRITNNGTVIRSATVSNLPATGTTGNVSFAAVPNEDITDIHILIEGPGGNPDD